LIGRGVDVKNAVGYAYAKDLYDLSGDELNEAILILSGLDECGKVSPELKAALLGAIGTLRSLLWQNPIPNPGTRGPTLCPGEDPFAGKPYRFQPDCGEPNLPRDPAVSNPAKRLQQKQQQRIEKGKSPDAPTPQTAVDPKTAFDISSGRPGSTPNLDGGGFYPNKDVTITESGPAGSRTVAVVTADAYGSFNITFQIADSTPEGRLTYTFRQEPDVKVSDTFDVWVPTPEPVPTTEAAPTREETPTIEPSETPTSAPTETATASTPDATKTAEATTAPKPTPSASVPFYTLAPTS
jgi:hypothetical protein